MQTNPVNRIEEDSQEYFSELWKDLENASTLDESFHCWLALQCSLIPQSISAILVMQDYESNTYLPVSKWPETGGDPEIFSEILDQVLERKTGLLVETGKEASFPHFVLAYPVLFDSHMHGIVALEVAALQEDKLKQAMWQLQWGVSWLENFYRREESEKDKSDLKRMTAAVNLLARILTEERFEGAAMAFVTELAGELSCDRASIAFAHRKKMRVKAFSHSAKFSGRMNLIRSIGKAMDEAVVQRREIVYPADKDELVILRDHKQLSSQYGAGTILTMPLYGDGSYYGAVTLERPPEMPFSEEETEFGRSVSALAGPVLEGKRKHDRHMTLKVWDSLGIQMKRIIGPGYVGRKLFFALSLFLLLFFTFKQGDYCISADTVLEGEIIRSVSAPFTGYIKESGVRAGDIVSSEQILCLMDDSDLRLERLNWLSQRVQMNRQYQEALAGHNRAEVNIINARMKQVEAELSLVENRLERTRIKAPFRGIIVNGDLTQSLGAMVQQGDVLFEVAPLDSYRVILKVDESRIADVKEGQSGTLVLPAMPGKKIGFRVNRITPISIAEDGQNRFMVEASLDNLADQLRPGMEGVGKIMVDRRNLFSIWSRTLKEKVVLWLWVWLP